PDPPRPGKREHQGGISGSEARRPDLLLAPGGPLHAGRLRAVHPGRGAAPGGARAGPCGAEAEGRERTASGSGRGVRSARTGATRTGPAAAPPPPSDLTAREEERDTRAEAPADTWPGAPRHFIALHVGGMLAHKRFTEESALRITDRVCQIRNDTETGDRRAAVSDSYRKH